MRKVKLNDKPLNVVDRWDELTLEHLLNLERLEQKEIEDPVEVFGAISGVPVAVVENAQAITDEIYGCVEFIYTQAPEWTKLKPPTHLVIQGKPYKLPKPDKCTLGQNIMLDNLMPKPMIDIVPEVLAIYFQPLIDNGKFDRHRVPEIQKMILKSNAIDCCATATFFLSNGKNLLRIFQVGYIQLKSTPSHNSPMTDHTKSTGGSSGSTTL